MEFNIRRFQEQDAAETSAVIAEALRVSNARLPLSKRCWSSILPDICWNRPEASICISSATGSGPSAAAESRLTWAARTRVSS